MFHSYRLIQNVIFSIWIKYANSNREIGSEMKMQRRTRGAWRFWVKSIRGKSDIYECIYIRAIAFYDEMKKNLVDF